MENNILISVLIPTYNRPDYLKECLNSVLEQKGFDKNELEFIISDNSENDDSKIIVEKYILENKDKNITYNKNEINLGMVGNWNKLLELSSGEYFIFLSDDDKFYDENSLKILYDNLIKYDVDVCYGIRPYINEYGIINEELIDMNLSMLKDKNHRFTNLKEQLIGHSMGFGGILYKSQDIFFLENTKEMADYDFNLRYLKLFGKCLIIKNKVFLYRIHTNQLSKGIIGNSAIIMYHTTLKNLELNNIFFEIFLIIKFLLGHYYGRYTGKIGYKILFFLKKIL